MRSALGLAVCVVPIVAVAAPVPAHLMPRTEVRLRHDSTRHPLGNTYEIEIRNTGAADLQIWTDRPYGLAAFLDVEIRNGKGDLVSRSFIWGGPASKGAPIMLRETIPAGKSQTTTLPLFNSVDEKSLVPGTYKVRVRFQYKDHDATSDWLRVEVSAVQIRTKHIELGP